MSRFHELRSVAFAFNSHSRSKGGPMTTSRQDQTVITVLTVSAQESENERKMGSAAEGTLSDPRPIDPERFNLPIPPSGSSLLKKR